MSDKIVSAKELIADNKGLREYTERLEKKVEDIDKYNDKLKSERYKLSLENENLKNDNDKLRTVQACDSRSFEELQVKLNEKDKLIEILEEEAANRTMEVLLLDSMLESFMILRNIK